MSGNEHWMDRLWREKGHKVRWVLLPALPIAGCFVLYAVMAAFDKLHGAVFTVGMVSFGIVMCAIGHLIDHYNKTMDD